MKILEEIEQQISWLKRNVSSNDLVGKLQKAEELALNTYYLATLTAEWYERMTTAEFMFKSSIASTVAVSQGGVAKSEAKARSDYREFWEEAKNAENTHKRLQLALNQCNIIIEQVRQSCAHLRNELRNQQ